MMRFVQHLPAGSVLLFAVSCAPFAFVYACDDGTATRPAGASAVDASGAGGGGGGDADASDEDVAPRQCPPASSLSPVVPTAALAGSVASRSFSLEGAAGFARPVGSLAGFYEVEFSEGTASCTNPDGGTRGLRLVLPADGRTCSASDPIRAEFFHVRPEGAPATAPSSYVRPAGTEGVVTARRAGSTLSVGVVVGAFASAGLPADGLSGTAPATVCP
jgi:hypothetical protein